MGKPSSAEKLMLALVVLLALGVRVWGIGFGLPYENHPDEHQYVQEGLYLLFNRDANPHKFNNPTLLKYLLCGEYAALYGFLRITGKIASLSAYEQFWYGHSDLFYLMARTTTALCGALTIPLVWKAGRKLSGPIAGLLSAVLLSFAFLHVRDSHFAVNDVPVTFLMSATLVASINIRQRGAWQDYLAAGALGGIATSTKYTGCMTLLTIGAAHILRYGECKGTEAPKMQLNSRLAASFGLFGTAFLAGTPYSILDWDRFCEDLTGLHSSGAQGYKGILLDPSGGYVFYGKTLLLGLGYGLAILCILSSVYLIWRSPKSALLLLIMPVAIYVFFGAQQMFFARFLITALPPLLVCCGVVLADITQRMQFARPRVGHVAIAVLCVIALGQSVRDIVYFDMAMTRKDTRTLAREWIEENAEPGTRLARESNGPKLPGESPPAPANPKALEVDLIKGRKIGDEGFDYYLENYDYVLINSYQYDLALTDNNRAMRNESVYDALDRIGAIA